MVSANTLIKKLLSVNNCVIDGFDFETDIDGVTTFRVYLHTLKRHSNCRPVCGKRCPVYDKSRVYRKWRALDLGGTVVELYSFTKRVCCKEHGIKTASVPWSYPGSRFTKDFDMIATFLAMNINKKVAAEYLRCDRHIIMKCISRVRKVVNAKVELKFFFWRATHSRIQVFKELAYKIRRHEKHILNTIETQLSNARVEAINNKIKLFIRKAYGFRNIKNMLDMILLGCSKILIQLPNRGGKGLKVA